MNLYGEPLYGEVNYGESANNVDFFLRYLVDTQPPAYREFRDFLERLLLPTAEDLDRVHSTFDAIPSYIEPGTSPGEWLDWILTEWFGWTLIPEGYPVARKRRLLANLHAHYKRRYTVAANAKAGGGSGLLTEGGLQLVAEDGQPLVGFVGYDSIDQQLADPESGDGLRLLLREFGIVAEVYDRRSFVGGWYGSYGSVGPLRVRIRVLGYEPFSSPQQVYTRSFVGGRGLYGHTTRQVITEEFVLALIHWSRAAGVEILVEFITGRQALLKDEPIVDDDEIIIA